jgi:hypothetical protein
MNLKLGVSLNYLDDSIQNNSLERIRQSEIATLEVPSRFFYPDAEKHISIINE